MVCLHFPQMELEINLIWSNKVKTSKQTKQAQIKNKQTKSP